MSDTRDFKLPDLGEGLEEADLLEWYVGVGDTIGLNDPLCQVETAKATVDVPSPFAGTVVDLVGDVGETLQVGEVFVRIDTAPPGGTPDADTVPGGTARGGSLAESTAKTERKAVLVGYGVAGDGAKRRRRRAGDSAAATATTGRALAKPTVRKLAKDNGIDLTALSPGTGPDGIVTREDVETALIASGTVGEALRTVDGSAEGGDNTARNSRRGGTVRGGSFGDNTARGGSLGEDRASSIPLKGIRRSIADAMTLSRATIPDAACGLTVDCTRLMALRDKLREDQPALTPFALIARFTVAALGDHPTMNARIDVDAGRIDLLDDVHLGLAVDTPNGLLVPVVSAAQTRSTPDLASEMRRLALGARDRSLTPAELTGSTFTISNFGAFGLEDGYPVINPPEAAILGVGAIVERPWVVDGALAVRRVARLTLVFDHRIADGAQAGRFLSDIATLIENPETIPVTA
ncbi:MAG: dihydrolipoamide acetyltransferase family protein [Acidimicrobiales bacterium]